MTSHAHSVECCIRSIKSENRALDEAGIVHADEWFFARVDLEVFRERSEQEFGGECAAMYGIEIFDHRLVAERHAGEGSRPGNRFPVARANDHDDRILHQGIFAPDVSILPVCLEGLAVFIRIIVDALVSDDDEMEVSEEFWSDLFIEVHERFLPCLVLIRLVTDEVNFFGEVVAMDAGRNIRKQSLFLESIDGA